jgi:hypothetical protein
MDDEEKEDLIEWVDSVIQFCLSDVVLREVAEETTTIRLWIK